MMCLVHASKYPDEEKVGCSIGTRRLSEMKQGRNGGRETFLHQDQLRKAFILTNAQRSWRSCTRVSVGTRIVDICSESMPRAGGKVSRCRTSDLACPRITSSSRNTVSNGMEGIRMAKGGPTGPVFHPLPHPKYHIELVPEFEMAVGGRLA
jgi:hypothetical protein